jgi:hypothetical protein
VDPLVVDLGYGASAVTTVELAKRLWVNHPHARILGLELDPERVARAQPAATPPALEFRQGGFELAGTRPILVRAFNVLRQYNEEEVAAAWRLILDQMPMGGWLVEGTCDEIGRLCSWIVIDHSGPRTLTLSAKLSTMDYPSVIAERLPKALIHHNIPGEPIYNLLSTLDSCWNEAAPHQTFGARSRWIKTVQMARERGWPIQREPRRWRLGELTVDFTAVSPQSTFKRTGSVVK